MAFTLIYLSSMVTPPSRAELLELLLLCRRRNAVSQITGLLVYRDGTILQLLEGEEVVVRQLYRRISSDPRHTALLTVWTGHSGQRRFPHWTMGFDGLDDDELDTNDAVDHALQDQTSNLLVTTAHGSDAQRDFVRRRTRAVRQALVHGGSMISTLAVVLHGHEPSIVGDENGSTQLHCHECRVRDDLDGVPYPCTTARESLRSLEISNQAHGKVSSRMRPRIRP